MPHDSCLPLVMLLSPETVSSLLDTVASSIPDSTTASTGEFIPLAPLLSTLGVMMTLALMVERLMTIANWLIDRLFIAKTSVQMKGEEQLKKDLKVVEQAKEEEELLNAGPSKAALSGDPQEIEPNPKRAEPESRFDLKELTPPDPIKVTKEFWIQIFGGLVAVAGCYYMKFTIWPLVVWMQTEAHGAAPRFWEFVITGIIIGAGSKPVNFLMNFLINRKIVITQKEAAGRLAPSPVPVAEPAVTTTTTAAIVPANQRLSIPSIEDIVGFKYDGGDRPQRLEHTHRRTKAIDLIVYHHTAMHSDAPFEEVVKEFDRKGWLTGYHAVVFKDGKIRVLCRWDRTGNHVQGHNSRSLGVSLQGNFESNPRVPFSNVNGRLGIKQPTLPQLEATARVIALWTQLYGVPVDFKKNILPHKELNKNKACPGNNFPYRNLEKLVDNYIGLWSTDKSFKQALKKFKLTPMVMA